MGLYEITSTHNVQKANVMSNKNIPDRYGDDEPTDEELDEIEAEQDAEGDIDPLVGIEDADDDFDFGDDDEDFVFDSED